MKNDQGPEGKRWTDEEIQHVLDVHPSTVEQLRKRFVEEGLEAALKRKEQKNRNEGPGGDFPGSALFDAPLYSRDRSAWLGW